MRKALEVRAADHQEYRLENEVVASTVMALYREGNKGTAAPVSASRGADFQLIFLPIGPYLSVDEAIPTGCSEARTRTGVGVIIVAIIAALFFTVHHAIAAAGHGAETVGTTDSADAVCSFGTGEGIGAWIAVAATIDVGLTAIPPAVVAGGCLADVVAAD